MEVKPLDMAAVRQRLDEEVTRQRRSRKEVSTAAGLSEGYLHNILTREQIPTVDKLDAICRSLGVSLPWIMYGVELPADYAEIFQLLEKNPKKFYALLALIE